MAIHPTQQRLRDQSIEPTLEIIASYLKEAIDAYLTFINQVSALGVDFHYQYYPDGQARLGKGVYRWLGKRGGKKEMNLFCVQSGMIISKSHYTFLRLLDHFY